MVFNDRFPFALSRTVGAAALASGLGLAGCSATPAQQSPAPNSPPAAAGSAAAAAPSSAALQWTGTVCSSLQPLIGTLTSPPKPDINDLAATRQSYLGYLDAAAGQAQAARQQITTAGPPPVADGDAISARVGEQLTQLNTNLDQARQQVRQTDPNDAASITKALTAAGNVGGSLVDGSQVLSELRQNTELAQAVDQEPSCAPLRSVPGGS